jgi:hypothetical protein
LTRKLKLDQVLGYQNWNEAGWLLMKPQDDEGGPKEATHNVSMISLSGKLVPNSSLLHFDLYVKCLLPESDGILISVLIANRSCSVMCLP